MESSKSKTTNNRLTRQDLLVSPEFWIENIRTELFNIIQDYMEENNLTRKQLAEQLGVSKGYISQVLNGESDHRISKLVGLALRVGKAPYFYFKNVDKVLGEDEKGKNIYINFEELESKRDQYDSMYSNLENVSEDSFTNRVMHSEYYQSPLNDESNLVQESHEEYNPLAGSGDNQLWETNKNPMYLQHRVPKIAEINIQLIDVNFYFGDTIDKNNINTNMSVKASFDNNLITFFIHVEYLYEDSNSKKHALFHTDYLSVIELVETETSWKNKKTVEVGKSFLAHLLGMSFLMVRGAIAQRLSSNFLASISLPVINPMVLLNDTLVQKGENYTLKSKF